jgi:hypothetical protein
MHDTSYAREGSGANRRIGSIKVAIQSIWRLVMSKEKVWRGCSMVGFSGIELMHRSRKSQFDLCALGLKDTAALYVWNAVMFNK